MDMIDAELLANHEFLALCRRWEMDGRAPLPGADWFTERGMDGEAAAWVWAATEPNRRNFRRLMSKNTADPEMIGTSPRLSSVGKRAWGWAPHNTDDGGPHNDADDLPDELFEKPDCLWLPSFPAAILWFLKRSVEVCGPAGPPSSVPYEAAAT